MKIKMYHVSNLEKFMELVSQCKGNVYVVSEDGDKLNLKSKLTQFVALSKLLLPDISRAFLLRQQTNQTQLCC